jgi:DNA-binding transcriptional LysR family regulator
VYLAILILLFYTEDRWAYMIGIVAPAMWLAMTFATGLLGGAWRQVWYIEQARRITNPVSFLAVSAVLSVLMIALCARRWVKEYVGLGQSLSTLAVSLGIVAVYYGILVAWFWHLIPFTAAQN